MGERKIRDAILAFGLLVFAQSGALASLVGGPPVTRLVPGNDVFPANFSITEDDDGVIYVGNAGGVLTFDGERWHLIALPGHNRVRAVAYGGHDRVYVGSRNVFGYIARDATGRERFHDLTPLFAQRLHGKRFGEIWDVLIARDGVLFAGIHHLFLYNPATGKTRLWHYRGRLGAVASQNGALLVQFRGEGLKRLSHGRWELVPDGAALTQQIYRMVPLPDGGLLLLAGDGRWRVYRDGRLEKFPVPAGFPSASHFSDGRVLSDGTLALASDAGSVYFLGAHGRDMRQTRVGDGYLSALAVGRDGGLLVVGDNAVYHIAWPSRWTMLGPEAGLIGDVHALARWGQRWFALTSAGVLASVAPAPATGPIFKPTNWTQIEAWVLLPIDTHSALLAGTYALDEIRDGHAYPVTGAGRLYPVTLRRSRFNPNVVFAGTDTGIAVIAREDGRWHVKLKYTDKPVQRIDYLVEGGPHRIWTASSHGGVALFTLSADNARIVNIRRFGTADGLVYNDDGGAEVFRLNDGSILVTTTHGEYRWNGSRFVSDDLGGLDALRKPGEWLAVAEDPGGDPWAYSWNHVYHRTAQGWRAEDVGKLRRGIIENFAFDETGAALLVAAGSILRYDLDYRASPGTVAPRVRLRSVELSRPDGTHRRLPLHSPRPLRLPQGNFGLTFSFALANYDTPGGVDYNARLRGFEPPMKWSKSSRYTYSRLHASAYRFELRGRDGRGRVTEAEPFDFTIVPPWYRSGWAQALWTLLALTLIAALATLGIRARTRRLAAKTLRLEHMVAERTSALESANRQLESMAHLDGLTGIPNRRRLDDYMEEVWIQCRERRRSLSALLIDVDHFKIYNDRHGHPAGDAVLKRLVTTLSRCLRRSEDLLARYGGEEFLAVLPGAEAGVAAAIAEQMRASVEEADLDITISIGLATCLPRAGQTVWELVKAADRALYQAKTAGRNRAISNAKSPL